MNVAIYFVGKRKVILSGKKISRKKDNFILRVWKILFI